MESKVAKFKPRYPHSYLVKCLNCDLLWERITVLECSSYTVVNADLQYNCPKCGSNAFTPLKDEERK